eukprot:TRINITY_DN1716_c0_g1_i3.p1 TRINITY_DN1716_c0_g1~~TRINITY_DN1716_c0_g1_i3.p1  ORF type:complete len:567 (+),score=128.94 TRINITY_DN1716_c0_g1_i3:30-1703(+)
MSSSSDDISSSSSSSYDSSESSFPSSSEEGELYPAHVDHYTSTMFCLAASLLIILPISLIVHRKHPLLRARYVYVCIVEIVVVCVALMIDSSSTSNTFFAGWERWPCWCFNMVEVAFCAVIWNTTASRLMLYYRSAQVHLLRFPMDSSIIDRLVHYFGIINAPREFSRCEMRLKFIQKEHMASLSAAAGGAGGDDIYDADDDLTTMTADNSTVTSTNDDDGDDVDFGDDLDPRRKQIIMDIVLWVAKLSVWWSFWALFAILLTYVMIPHLFSIPLLDVEETCYDPSMYLIEAQLLLWNIIQFSIVISWLRKSSSDSLGLKNELIFMQTLFIIMWVADAIQVITQPTAYETSAMYYDLLCYVIHALVTAIYPLALIYYRKFSQKKLKKSAAEQQTLEAIWSNEAGRAVILDVVSRGFSIENTLFLFSSERYVDHPHRHRPHHHHRVHRRKLRKLYKKFIHHTAPFPIDIMDDLQIRWAVAVKDRRGGGGVDGVDVAGVGGVALDGAGGIDDGGEGGGGGVRDDASELVMATRAAVFAWLTENYGYEIHRELEDNSMAM